MYYSDLEDTSLARFPKPEDQRMCCHLSTDTKTQNRRNGGCLKKRRIWQHEEDQGGHSDLLRNLMGKHVDETHGGRKDRQIRSSRYKIGAL